MPTNLSVPVAVNCIDCFFFHSLQENECFTDRIGRDYRGTVSQTRSGKSCQKWTANSPHSHSRTPQNYENAGLGDHNYCRNPDNTGDGTWCYTTDSGTRWEACDVGSAMAFCGKLQVI